MKNFLSTCFCILAGTAHADWSASHTPFTMPVSHHDTAVEGAVWYPTRETGSVTLYGDNVVFHGTPVQRDAPLAKGRFPIVLVSHGLGGNMRTLSWLTAGLAKRGAIVISVDHPNSTTTDFDIKAGLQHGTRARDLSAALDHLLQDTTFAGAVDSSRIMATGFSYGGWTALSLGGLTGDLAGYADHCANIGDASTHCADIARASLDLFTFDVGLWNASYRDDRVTDVAAIDPGLLYGLGPDNVTDLLADTTLIGLGTGADRLLATDFSSAGSGFADLVPGASVVSIAPANHFSALLTCKPVAPAILQEEGEPPICTDPPQAERTVVHDQILATLSDQLGL